MSEAKFFSIESLNWQKFKEGDVDAFELIYKSYFSKLYNYGCKMTKNKALVEDCLQNFFVKLWTQKESINTPQSVKSYLFRAFRNALLNALNQQNRFTSSELNEEEYDHEFEISYEQEVIDLQFDIEKREIIKKALEKLSKRQKEVLFLKFYEGLSYEQISETMQLELKSVYNLVSKAIEEMRKFL